MLPARHRMRRSRDFAAVIQGGARARGGPLLVHQRRDFDLDVAVVGLVVGRAVGNSVIRHRVARRLRAQVARRMPVLPAGSGTVVRALPGAAHASSAQLGAGLDQALARLAGR